jgi:hypothetical protein
MMDYQSYVTLQKIIQAELKTYKLNMCVSPSFTFEFLATDTTCD